MTAAALRRQHLARHLHRLGARALDELLVELGAAHGIADDILAGSKGMLGWTRRSWRQSAPMASHRVPYFSSPERNR